MNQYEAISRQIERARIQRSIYVAELISDVIADLSKRVMTIVDSVGEGSQKRFGRGYFAIDA